MPNKDIFSTKDKAEPTDTLNLAGGKAYAKSPEGALANIACTGTFQGTFYAAGKDQFDWFLDAAKQCSEEFVAKVAIYARRSGFMKDAPAILAAYLFAQGSVYFPGVFEKVIDNGRMLRTFVQVIRSGVMGRKSFGSRGKKAIQNWLNTASTIQIMRASVGNEPSLRDILRMVHVKPTGTDRDELYHWVVNGKVREESAAPKELQQFLVWHRGEGVPPRMDHRALEFEGMTSDHWRTVGRQMGWMGLRMNLNTLNRHDAFKSKPFVGEVAARLKDREQVLRARQFPYQIFQAWKQTEGLPHEVQEGLQDALEIALENIPEIPGEIAVIVDTSGSMQSSISGYGRGNLSKTTCVDVAGLFAAAMLRKNPGRVSIVPVDTEVHPIRVNPRDSVVSMAQHFASLGGGGTYLGAAMKYLRDHVKVCDLVVVISDNESWADYDGGGYRYHSGTGLGEEWVQYKRLPGAYKAKLVNIDIQGSVTSQTKPASDVLMVSGFSDTVFKVVEAFNEGGNDGDFWVNKIKESIAL